MASRTEKRLSALVHAGTRQWTMALLRAAKTSRKIGRSQAARLGRFTVRSPKPRACDFQAYCQKQVGHARLLLQQGLFHVAFKSVRETASPGNLMTTAFRRVLGITLSEWMRMFVSASPLDPTIIAPPANGRAYRAADDANDGQRLFAEALSAPGSVPHAGAGLPRRLTAPRPAAAGRRQPPLANSARAAG
jgi:hypothetical protein